MWFQRFHIFVFQQLYCSKVHAGLASIYKLFRQIFAHWQARNGYLRSNLCLALWTSNFRTCSKLTKIFGKPMPRKRPWRRASWFPLTKITMTTFPSATIWPSRDFCDTTFGLVLNIVAPLRYFFKWTVCYSGVFGTFLTHFISRKCLFGIPIPQTVTVVLVKKIVFIFLRFLA